MKSEVKEVKNLLRELCKQKNVFETEDIDPATAVATAAATGNPEVPPTGGAEPSEQRGQKATQQELQL